MRCDLAFPITDEEFSRILHCNVPSFGMLTGITTDSRTVLPGDCFIALHGKTDGDPYIEEALSKGAVCALSGQRSSGSILRVADPLRALGQIAKVYQQAHPVRTIAITGSVGKTTAKEMLSLALSQNIHVCASVGNHNNEIGLPMTILGRDAKTEMLILEMGMRHTGDIAYLADIAKPDLALVTALGTSHIGLMGSFEAIVKEKLSVSRYLSHNGILIYPADCDEACRLMQGTPGAFGFSLTGPAPFCELSTEQTGSGCCSVFLLRGQQVKQMLTSAAVPIRSAALCALSACQATGLLTRQAQQAISRYVASNMRLERRPVGQVTFLLDCYNASPESVKAAFLSMKQQATGRTVALLGDMLELGQYADLYHREIGSAAAEAGISLLFLYGAYAQQTASGAKAAGLPAESIFTFPVHTPLGQIADAVYALLSPGDTVLFKASRDMHAERIALLVQKHLSRD